MIIIWDIIWELPTYNRLAIVNNINNTNNEHWTILLFWCIAPNCSVLFCIVYLYFIVFISVIYCNVLLPIIFCIVMIVSIVIILLKVIFCVLFMLLFIMLLYHIISIVVYFCIYFAKYCWYIFFMLLFSCIVHIV